MKGARSIIVCDDEVELAQEIGEFFQAQGWRVRLSATASAVRAALDSGFAPSCLLTDLRLGQDGDGAALISYARRLSPPLRPKVIALITGHVAESTPAGNFGADLLYFKPADPFVILEDINKLVMRTAKAPILVASN